MSRRRCESKFEAIEWAVIAGMVVAGLVAIIATVGVWRKTNFAANLQTDPTTQEANE